jgi:hypothetical protein
MKAVLLAIFCGLSAWAADPKCIEGGRISESNPERSIAKLLKQRSISDDERFVRLIFAETFASNCTGSDEEAAVIAGIAWVLRNRKLNPAFGDVVTARRQFRSTFGDYDVARRKEFLCPSAAGANWRLVWDRSLAAWQATANASNPLSGVTNYYLGRHFENSKLNGKFPRPSWAASPNQRMELPGLKADSACVEFWKVTRFAQ